MKLKVLFLSMSLGFALYGCSSTVKRDISSNAPTYECNFKASFMGEETAFKFAPEAHSLKITPTKSRQGQVSLIEDDFIAGGFKYAMDGKKYDHDFMVESLEFNSYSQSPTVRIKMSRNGSQSEEVVGACLK